MSDRDALVLTLVRGLEHAATALDVVNDATRREVGALLSPKARQLLAALTAASTDAAAPLGDAAEAIEASDPQPKRQKASASKPTGKPKKRRHVAESSDDDDARPRTASGLQAFPEDVLGAIIAFVDLPMRFTCVVACGAMRDAAAKLSPRLEHALVLRRYPMLATTGSTPTDAQPPRELLRTYKRYFRSTRRFALPLPITTLDEYTFSLELDVNQALPTAEGAQQRFRRRSVWIGTGTLSADDSPAFSFSVPNDVYEKVDDYMDRGWHLKAKVMASRQVSGGRVQIAKLFYGGVDDMDYGGVYFSWEIIPYNRRNKALDWLLRINGDHELDVEPQLALYWNLTRREVRARFAFMTPDDRGDMSLSDACMTLEHFVEWSK